MVGFSDDHRDVFFHDSDCDPCSDWSLCRDSSTCCGRGDGVSFYDHLDRDLFRVHGPDPVHVRAPFRVLVVHVRVHVLVPVLVPSVVHVSRVRVHVPFPVSVISRAYVHAAAEAVRLLWQ